jgi:hypothetical protein
MEAIFPDEVQRKAAQPDDVLRNCIAEIELLRERRQQRARDEVRDDLRRFTQQELADEVCPTYKNLLTGRSHRMPDRGTLLNIARYLECTIAETGDLLSIAGYAPEPVYMRADLYRAAIEQAIVMAEHSTLPAYVLSADLQVIHFNASRRKMSRRDVPLAPADHPDASMVSECYKTDSIAHYINSPTASDWERNGLAIMRFFRKKTKVFQHEVWFQRRIETLRRTPEFDRFWRLASEPGTPDGVAGQTRYGGVRGPVHISSIVTELGGPGGPLLYNAVPQNDAAREVMRAAGATLSTSQIQTLSH